MADQKNSNEMTEADLKAGLHLQTLDADVNIEDMFGEGRNQREKALVRKIDIRMMPLMMLLCKCVPKYDHQPANPASRHFELFGPQQHRHCPTGDARERHWARGQPVQHRHQCLLRRLHPHAGPHQHDPEQDPPIHFPPLHHGRVGNCIRRHGCCPKLWRHGCAALRPGFRRSPLLP